MYWFQSYKCIFKTHVLTSRCLHTMYMYLTRPCWDATVYASFVTPVSSCFCRTLSKIPNASLEICNDYILLIPAVNVDLPYMETELHHESFNSTLASGLVAWQHVPSSITRHNLKQEDTVCRMRFWVNYVK